MNRWASSVLLVLAAACSGAAPAGPVPSDSGAEPADGRFEVSGAVLDLAGTPVVDVFVTVSTEFCIPDRTDETGAFAVQEVDPGAKRLITYGETAANGLFASAAFAFEADDALAFDTPVWTPALASWPIDADAVGEQAVAAEDGLVLTISPGALTLAPFAPAEVQVARVPIDQAPPFVPDGVELVDLFALGPILSTFDPPAEVVFPGDTGLQAGASVVFHSLDYDTGLLVVVAHGTVDEAGRPTTADGEGIPELTWVGVSLE